MSSSELIRATLDKLRRHGFGDEPILSERGNVRAMYFARRWRTGCDAVLVDAAGNAHGYRIRPTAEAVLDPLDFDHSAIVDYLVPKSDVVTVVNLMLATRSG